MQHLRTGGHAIRHGGLHQAADGAFITHYAKAHPNREDLAETALSFRMSC